MNNFLLHQNARNSIYSHSYFINKFINKFIKHGKKKVIEKNVYKAFRDLKPKNAIFILLKSLWILKPLVRLLKTFKHRSKKKRKKIILIPTTISLQQQYKFAISWLINFITMQKKSRRRHRSKNIIRSLRTIRGMSKSKKKTFYDRFQVAFANQRLAGLIKNKFDELNNTRYAQLIRKKLHLHMAVTNNRINYRFRYK